MKFSRATKIGLAAVGGLLLLWGVVMLFLSGPTKRGPAFVDTTHCPDCGSLLNKQGECPKCMATEGQDAYRTKRANKGAASSNAIPITLGALFGLLLLTHIGINLRAYYARRGEESDVYYHVRCTKCGRKLRYREKQIEHLGRCPMCQKPIRFPKPPEAARTNHWAKIRQIVWG